MVTIGVLALQGDVAEHVRALENSGARALLVRRVSELDQVDGLVIPGGESTTMSNLLLSFGLFDELHDRIEMCIRDSHVGGDDAPEHAAG